VPSFELSLATIFHLAKRD